MLKNYFTIAFRSIFRNKLTAFINIAGLALAIASALLICLFVMDELSYDRYHSKADRIYRLTREFKDNNGATNLHLVAVAPPFAPLLKADFSEIETIARAYQYRLVVAIEENGERKKITTENNLFVTEPEIFDIFDIPLVNGNPKKSLERPFTVMLSEMTALKYFETTDCIGKHMKAGRRLDLEVTGVYKNFPRESHWHPELIVSFATFMDSTVYGARGLERNYGDNSFTTFMTLAPGSDPASMESRFPEFLDRRYGTFAIANFNVGQNFVASKATALNLQKVTDIHLRSQLDGELEPGGNINTVTMIGLIGFFIILIACFNFVNLSTARASKRAKEVGLRKVAGAHKTQLILQYLSESILVALFALVLALALASTALPWLNGFTGKELTLDFTSAWPVILGCVVFALVVGALAGVYPAFVISSFKPTLVLKGQQGSIAGRGNLRKVLVISQFAISIALIIATAIIVQQLGFLNNRDLGYEKDKVVVLPVYSEMTSVYDALYNELTKSSAIKNATLSTRPPTDRLLDYIGTGRIMKNDSLVDTNIILRYVGVDYEFFDTYGIELAAGRNFSKAIPTDDSLAFIVNETAARAMGWKTNEEGIGQDFQYGRVKGKLVGIVKDFHFESLHQEIQPMIFLIPFFSYSNFSVKIAGDNMQQGLEALQKVWKDFLPIRPFDYTFVNDQYQRLYDSEQKQSQLFTVFSGLAVFIACLGLFGLATFNTLQRLKEIGIRKVLGASVGSILSLLSREIIVLIVVANAVAWPVAWYFMDQWLAGFAYHINMNGLIFLGAATAAIVIALLTVSIQTIRAAMMNPATTLRYE